MTNPFGPGPDQVYVGNWSGTDAPDAGSQEPHLDDPIGADVDKFYVAVVLLDGRADHVEDLLDMVPQYQGSLPLVRFRCHPVAPCRGGRRLEPFKSRTSGLGWLYLAPCTLTRRTMIRTMIRMIRMIRPAGHAP